VAEDRSQQQPIKLRVSQRWEGKFLGQLIEYLLHKNACSVELIMLIRVIIETIHAIIFSVMQSIKIWRRLTKMTYVTVQYHQYHCTKNHCQALEAF